VAEQNDEKKLDTSSEDGESIAESENMETKGDEEDSAIGSAQSGAGADDDEPKDLEFILDIPLEVSVELGRTRMQVNDLLRLGQGSIVELSKLADEPMDIYVNRKLFARGEVVVVNEKFGIRLTDIISAIDRVKTLG